MTDLSHQEAAVLGILYEHHHYAYRIQEIMEKRGMDNWADIEFSSIHNILEQLETIKLVQSNIKAENGGQTSRKVYYITNEGKLVLKKKIKTILSKKGKIIYPFDLGLANMYVLSHSELIQSLELYLKSVEDRIYSLEYVLKIQEENNLPYNFIAIYSRSLLLLKAERGG